MTIRSPASAPAIGDYAIIGDCRSAALVSRNGSIDWLCWPRFDSPSVFAAMLDRAKGGFFSVAPVGDATVSRRYLESTNVLETTFRTPTGVLRLTDLMPVASEADKRAELLPQREILRRLECTEGEVTVEVRCDPRPDYGRVVPRLRSRGAQGVWYEHEGRALVLRCDLPTELSDDLSDVGVRNTMRAGDRHYLSLVSAVGEPAVLPALGGHAEFRIQRSIDWWRAWARRCTYDGPYRDTVLRSALTLKLWSTPRRAPSSRRPPPRCPKASAACATGTTATAGCATARSRCRRCSISATTWRARRSCRWLLHTTSMTLPELQVLYDVYGETRLKERTLDYLSGFADSRPVRIGNDAHGQLQLDIYGEVVDAVHAFTARGGRLDRGTRRMLAGFGEYRLPALGGARRGHLGAARRAPAQYLLESHVLGGARPALPAERRRAHQRAHGALPAGAARDSRRHRDPRVQREAGQLRLRAGQRLGGRRAPPAVALRIRRRGIAAHADHLPPHSPDPRGRWTALPLPGDDDGLPGHEGAFGICSFWAVSYLAQAGGATTRRPARSSTCSRYANDLGLFAEEIDPTTGAALGNFPQAFTHVGLIDAALQLAHERGTHLRPTGDRQTDLTSARL